MPVTSADLLAAANRSAVKLGAEPLSPRMLRDLVDDHVLVGGTNKGTKRGESWLYPDEAVSTVENVVDFRSQGASRNTQLKLCLWQFGTEYSFDVLKNALKEEFGRIRTRQGRQPPWWDYDHRDKHRYSEREIGKAKRRLPKLDGRLAVPGLMLGADSWLQIFSIAYWGKQPTDRSIAATALDGLNLFGDLPPQLSTALSFLFSIEGALGAPEETGLNALAQTTEDDLRFAREAIWLSYAALMAGQFLMKNLGVPENNELMIALDAAIASFLRPEWIVSSLALFSVSYFNYRNMSASKVH